MNTWKRIGLMYARGVFFKQSIHVPGNVTFIYFDILIFTLLPLISDQNKMM